jgi:hypothetical protein
MRLPSRRIGIGVVVVLFALVAPAAGPAWADPPPTKWPDAIEDNSFFLEEAYNQEKDVVQHISGLWLDRPLHGVGYSFTQEWPVRGQRHQLSYTVGYAFESGGGLGDLFLNYRYQLADSNAWAAMALRLSLLWPRAPGGGRGSIGLQVDLPASKRVSAGLAVHVNLGATLRRGVEGAGLDGRPRRADLSGVNLGASAIWLVSPVLNVMLEALANFDESFDASGTVSRGTDALLSPGLRYAINRGSLQIVPGVALPIRLSGEERGAGVFFYLSLEHPYKRSP